MLELSNEQLCILELVKASLFSMEPCFPENVDWNKVYEIAKSQCIVALVEPAVILEYRDKWMNAVYQNVAHFAKITYEQNELVQLFKNNDIPLVILKGTAAAIYYPEPARRTMGDIDFWVQSDKLFDAQRLMEENGFSFVKENSRHIEYIKNGIEFELHKKVGSIYYNDIENIYLEGINQAEKYSINNYIFNGFPKYLNGLVLLGHFMQHLKGTGIGIRHLIDWMMFVNKELDDDSWDVFFKELAVEAGLEKLAITLTILCKKWLGLPNEIKWCYDNFDDELVDSILERSFIDGNFGVNRSMEERVQSNMKKKGLFASLQQSGLKNWKLAQKYSIFVPFAWMYQTCRYVRKGLKAILSGERLFRQEKTKLEIEEIWRRLE